MTNPLNHLLLVPAHRSLLLPDLSPPLIYLPSPQQGATPAKHVTQMDGIDIPIKEILEAPASTHHSKHKWKRVE
jgi:hypothetical protein